MHAIVVAGALRAGDAFSSSPALAAEKGIPPTDIIASTAIRQQEVDVKARSFVRQTA
jgi:hypothetical protein